MKEILGPNDLKPFLSRYLMDGLRHEHLEIKKVVIARDEISCVVANQNRYHHFTVPSALLVVSQLAIIYGCWDHRLDAKQGEHLLRHFSIKCKRQLSQPEVHFSLQLRSKRRRNRFVFYSGDFAIGDDDFVGEASFVMPFPDENHT